jgi:CubicO group peptidase (beta-lactamase class C family)
MSYVLLVGIARDSNSKCGQSAIELTLNPGTRPGGYWKGSQDKFDPIARATFTEPFTVQALQKTERQHCEEDVGRHDETTAAGRGLLFVLSALIVTGVANSQDFSPCGVPNLPWAAIDSPIQTALIAGSGASHSNVEPATAALDDLYRNVPNEGAAGVAVLAVQNGKLMFKQAYGFADLETHLPLTTSSRLGIGSITKQFTAAAILKLQEHGKLFLADRLSKYFPSFPRGDEVTLAQLLSHTSGVHDIIDRQFEPDFRKPISRDRVLQVIEERPLDFDPGTEQRYSNAGYLLLGQIIEKVSGQSYAQYLQRVFFYPLGMRDTGVYDVDHGLPGMARGYIWNGKNLENVIPFHDSLTLSSGGIYSTVEDLTRWAQALMNHKALRKHSVEVMMKPAVLKDGSKTGYGEGFFIEQFRGQEEWAHDGGVHGYYGMLNILPKQRLTVITLTNGTYFRGGFDVRDLGHKTVARILDGQVAPIDPPTVSMPSSKLDQVTGQYFFPTTVSGAKGTMLIFRGGDKLFEWDSSQTDAQEIFATSDAEFFWKDSGASIMFSRDSTDKIQSYTYRSAYRTTKGERFSPAIDSSVDPASYELLAGSYQFKAGLTMTLTKRGPHLCLKVPPSPDVEIFPTSPLSYFILGADASLRFELGDAGKPIAAFARMGSGREGRAKRVDVDVPSE